MFLVNPYSPRERTFRREFVVVTLAIASPLAFLFVAFPELDLAVAAAVRNGCLAADRHQGWCSGWGVTGARQVFLVFFALAAAVVVAITARTLIVRGGVGLDQARCLFLVAALALGPGFVANTVFKDNWGRARPREIVEFGGLHTFTPPLMRAAECDTNCAFVSGEASSIYALFFALALLAGRQYKTGFLAVGIAAGTAAGLIRMSQGAHFLSDVLFAAVFMALTVSLVHMMMIGIWRETAAARTRAGPSLSWITGRGLAESGSASSGRLLRR